MDILGTAVEIFSLLAQDTRLLRLDFPNGDGPPGATLLANRLHAVEGLSQDFTYTVEAISDDASIPLDAVLGRMVTISMVRDDGTLRYFNGYVFEFSFERTDGGFAFYRMVVGPWLRLLRLRKDCALFQNMSVTDLCEKTFSNYIQRDYKYRLAGELPSITLAMQYNETDHNHLHRRLDAAGLYYWYEHRVDGHTLWISDDSTLAPQLEGDSAIPYRAESGASEEDGISRWSPARKAVPAQVTLDSFNFKEPRPVRADKLSAIQQGLIPPLEIYESTAAYGYSDDSAGEALAARRLEEASIDAMTVTATGNHRALMPGHWFTLSEHYEAGEPHLVVSLEHTASNNYQDGRHSNSSYECTMRCIPLNLRWRPARFAHCTDTRIHGLITATVVGPEGEDIHTDEYGRVRVQFHWDREGKYDPDSSPWVRVMTSLADSRFGYQSVPRVGQEVAVQFIDGNCDRPLIVGCIHNAQKMPAWELPKQRVLTGLRSREIKGARSNHVVLDDTQGKIQAQLRSDHQHSQLSLGHIGRIEDHTGRTEDRGEGWELATDAWGVARAGKGMLITTEARTAANGPVKGMDETIHRLLRSGDQHAHLAELALKNGAQEAADDQGDIAVEIAKQTEAIKGTTTNGKGFPEISAPHLILASPAGIVTTTNSSTHISSEHHTGLTSGKSLSLAAGANLFASVKQAIRLFVRKAGMKMVAAAGDIDIQALSDGINLLAKLEIKQTANRITISAKEEIVINGGGSYAKFAGGAIELGSAGPFTVHAAKHSLESAKDMNMAIKMPAVADVTAKGRGAIHLGTHGAAAGKSVSALPFILLKDGAVVEQGNLDEQGNAVFEHELDSQATYTLELPNGQQFNIEPGSLTAQHEISSSRGFHGYSNSGGSLTEHYSTVEEDRTIADPYSTE